MTQAPLRAQASSSSAPTPASSMPTALDALAAFVTERRTKGGVPKDFGAFERDLHARVMAVEREILAEELAAGVIQTRW